MATLVTESDGGQVEEQEVDRQRTQQQPEVVVVGAPPHPQMPPLR